MNLLIFNLVSCTTPSTGDDAVGTTVEKNIFSTREVMTGKTVNFPGEWSGKNIYLNFFMTT
ncbi:MAG: hypothetical protein GX887_02955 [Firmicutes bacterium]|nr:hypothetical protein [Bacillota bacterium]